MAGLRAVTDVRTAYLAVPVLLACLALLAGPIRPVGRAPHVVSPVRS